MAADLIIYGIVAAGLVLWLRNLLGTRHGDERSRPNPYMRSPDAPADMGGEGPVIEGEVVKSAQDRIADLADNPSETLSIADDEAESGLLAIAKADPDFDVKDFVSKAQDAFVYTVEAYANGDRDALADLTGEEVYAAFDRALQDREDRGETQKTEVLSFTATKVLDAALQGRDAQITLRFAASQINVIRNDKDEIIAGHDSKAFDMVDIWTFSRDVKSSDPRWFLVKTASETSDDNDVVPDTD